MDKKTLLKKIEENRTLQVDKYYMCMQRVIRNDPYYYANKKYVKSNNGNR